LKAQGTGYQRDFTATRYSIRGFYGVPYIAHVNYARTCNRILHRSRIESRVSQPLVRLRAQDHRFLVAARRFNIPLRQKKKKKRKEKKERARGIYPQWDTL
jgi:hypothetical protein